MARRRSERGAGRLPPWLPGIAPRWPMTTPPTDPPICSAKGCRAEAVWVHAWNNPKIHTPDRRKAWAACDDHRETLGAFLAARGFLRETVPLAEWEGSAADR